MEERDGFFYKNYYMDYDTFLDYLTEKCQSGNEPEIERLKKYMNEHGYSRSTVNRIFYMIKKNGFITKEQIQYIEKETNFI